MPFEEFHLGIEKAIEKLKVPHIRHACRSAFKHLHKAWVLHPIDAEMSAFRAITAEEEAAAAVIRALRHQDYPNASKLSDRNHVHKSALWPFITAVSNKMVEKNIAAPEILLQFDDEPRIELYIDIGKQAKLDYPLWGRPDEPFNFSMVSDRTGPFKLHDFSEELFALATENGARNIETYVNAGANKRNQLLYASEQGIPSVEFKDAYLLERRRRVITLLVLTIAIMQTSVHQLFLVQCLDALLRAVQRFAGEPLKLPKVDPTVPSINLAEQADGSMKLSLVRPIRSLSFSFTLTPES